VHHVGIVVEDLDAAVATWAALLGAEVELREVLPEQGVEAVALTTGSGCVELIAPLPAEPGAPPPSGVARFLEQRGGGLHHVAFEVADVAASLEQLARAGARLVDRAPRPGLHGTPVAFVHPSSASGVLVELVQSGGR
jgi:methylmalonyl-CoA/ethylmalonyl-CoA epimerase